MFNQRIAAILIACAWWAVPNVLRAQSADLSLVVTDVDTGAALPARLTLIAQSDGKHYFFKDESSSKSAVAYDKQNWINARSIERHTTALNYPVSATVPSGAYQLVVEHGKSHIPAQQALTIDDDQRIEVQLKRWNDLPSRGWYSGDTHVHRTVDDLRSVILAEDLNVVLPLTNWVTIAGDPPTKGDKNIADATRSDLIRVDDQHVIWPQNTEYEIFTVAGQPHVLGALFVLGHRQQLQLGVPPWKQVIDVAGRQSDHVAFDMDKLDWPFAMLLPTLAPHALVELSNNHVWQTEFAFRDWNSPAPNFMAPPFGRKVGGHRAWLDYTHGMYYALLDCGLRLPPSAGTANGVHPVPAGFGRVYVHVPDGFSFEKWMAGLKAGRSFVTTGPMLMATANGKLPGEVFSLSSADPTAIELDIEVDSLQPLLYGEVIINGRPEHLLRPQNAPTEIAGVVRTRLKQTIKPTRSGWAAIKFWQQSPDGQVRFAHTAPWYFDVDQQPVLPRRYEKQYLVDRMRAEINRSRGKVDQATLSEYEDGLKFYQSLPTFNDDKEVAASARPVDTKAASERWRSIFHMHRLTPDEVRVATGWSLEQSQQSTLPGFGASPHGLRVVPYPGGRHPRRGFLDGAINPQRDTKVSIFPPWDTGDSGYVVVDVPEAIFSNLGLTYLAHEHIPTIWDQQNIQLDPVEWSEGPNGLQMKRRLPNGIEFASRVSIEGDAVQMGIRLTNGTRQRLTGLRVQVCTMLGGLVDFNDQEPLESVIHGATIAIRSRGSQRWVITRWTPNQRVWQNPPVPCIHSDPIFPDCDPGQTVEVNGQLLFYEGPEIEAFLKQHP